MFDWIQSNETLFAWMAATSVVSFIASLVLVPLIIVRIPHDYFASKRRREKKPEDWRSTARVVFLFGKNVLGGILLLAGLAMLVLPGQGLLTILVAIMLLDFPGKYRVERWLVSRQPVLNSLNWLRKKRGRPPLKF